MIQQFKNLHKREQPVVLLNIWDNETADMLVQNNINIIATSSYAIAKNIGIEDGENLSFQKLLTIAKKIPGKFLSVDIESGYASTISELQTNTKILLESNIVGINIEDKFPDTHNLMNKELFVDRIKAIKKVDTLNQLFINARTDIFFFDDIEGKNISTKTLDNAIALILEYSNAGIDGIFIPGLKNKKFIEKIVEQINIPLNIMLDIKNDNIEDYLNLGISRISYGPSLYLDWTTSGLSKEMYFSQIIELFHNLQDQGKIKLA